MQRVNWANVSCIKGENIDLIWNVQKWILIYVGFEKWDYDKKDLLITKAAQRILNVPLFEDENGKIKRNLKDIDWEILLVPNFTLAGRNKKGNSIDYTNAENFEKAKELFEDLYLFLKDKVRNIAKWCFWEYMKIQSEVDGPVNIILDIK